MVHTFELSRMIDENTFEALVHSLKNCRFNRVAWTTTAYADKGISMVCLRKFKPRRKDNSGQWITLETEPYMYMVILSINTGLMFGNDGYRATNATAFTSVFIRAIYDRILELIPELEWNAELKVRGYEEYQNTGKMPVILQQYYDANTFMLRRIDYALDIAVSPQQYIQLIAWSKEIKRKTYKRQLYEQNIDMEDDEPDFDDMDDILQEFASDTKYVYYKSKSLNINIYLKGEQLRADGLISEDNHDYDFLRIEFQVKKNKLNGLNRKFKVHSRCFHTMPIPEMEAEVFNYYLNQLTGTGTYVTADTAKAIIDNADYKPSKKAKLKYLIELIVQKQGVTPVLNDVENGVITDLGKPSTVNAYLREIKELGINPVTLSAEMEGGTIEATPVNATGDILKVLPNLLDIASMYNQIEE